MSSPWNDFLQRARRWLRPPRRLRPTRDGVWFLLATLGVGFAAVNTGNNLLFFVLGLLLAAIIVSGVLSESNIRHLRVRRELPPHARAGEDAVIRLVVSNDKARTPSLGLTFSDAAPGAGEAFVTHAPAGEAGGGHYRLRCETRGPLPLSQLEVSTTWPFGLFTKSRTLEVEDTLLVWPRRIEVPDIDASSRLERGTRPHNSRGDGFDLFGLREYVPGEDARRIHWKASARAGEPIARENSAEDARTTLLYVVDHDPDGFEEAVARAAAAAERLLADGHHVGVCAGTGLLEPVSGAPAVSRILDVLALAQPDPSARPPRIPGVRVLQVGPGGVRR